MKQTQTTTDYQKQATDFLKSNGITFETMFLRNGKHFSDDTDNRDIYKIVLRRTHNTIDFDFGQSVAHSTGAKKYDSSIGKYVSEVKKPTAYDILACITKNNPETFEDFCSDFGYDEDSRKAKKIYKEVVKEWRKVENFFTLEEIEQLQDIS